MYWGPGQCRSLSTPFLIFSRGAPPCLRYFGCFVLSESMYFLLRRCFCSVRSAHTVGFADTAVCRGYRRSLRTRTAVAHPAYGACYAPLAGEAAAGGAALYSLRCVAFARCRCLKHCGCLSMSRMPERASAAVFGRRFGDIYSDFFRFRVRPKYPLLCFYAVSQFCGAFCFCLS